MSCTAVASRTLATLRAGVVLGSSLSVAVAFAAGGYGDSKRFYLNDWELACDNTRTCRAVGYQSDAADHEGDEPLALLVERMAGPGVVPKLQVMLGNLPEDEIPAPTRVHLLIDGRSQGHVQLTKDGTAPLSAAQAAGVLRAVVGTGEVTFRADERRWKLSSAGATAVLLRMDDMQGRVGTPGALVRKGSKPESQVLPPIPAPVVRAAPLAAARPDDEALGVRIRPLLEATLEDPHDCQRLTSPEGEPEPIAVQRLSADRVLVSAYCWLAAYNSGHGVWVAEDKPPYSPRLVTTMATDIQGDTIEAHHKGRGIGDCWGGDRWTWDGRSFVHTSSMTTGMCKLVAAGGAWALPTIVTAEGKTRRP